MAVHYTLHENNLLSDPSQRVARVRRHDPLGLEALADQIIQRGSTVSRADILSVLEDYHAAIENLLRLGMSINTPTANFRVSLKGVFEGDEDSFDPSRHRAMARVSAGRRLRQGLESVEVVKDEAPSQAPKPLTYADIVSGTKNQVLTPGEGALLTGYRLRFEQGDPEQGIFLIAEDGTATPVERLIKVMPSEASLIAPALPAGTYTLEVRANVNGNGKVLSGQLKTPLTVS
jgi:hypothetical protein